MVVEECTLPLMIHFSAAKEGKDNMTLELLQVLGMTQLGQVMDHPTFEEDEVFQEVGAVAVALEGIHSAALEAATSFELLMKVSIERVMIATTK